MRIERHTTICIRHVFACFLYTVSELDRESTAEKGLCCLETLARGSFSL